MTPKSLIILLLLWISTNILTLRDWQTKIRPYRYIRDKVITKCMYVFVQIYV